MSYGSHKNFPTSGAAGPYHGKVRKHLVPLVKKACPPFSQA